jgi:hypothetical protein
MSDIVIQPTDAEVRLLHRLRDTPEIFAAIAGGPESELAAQKSLRTQFDDELVRAALVVHDARKKARGELPHAEQLWLTRVGLEQSTAWEVARHKARRFEGREEVFDLCCGVGIDAAAQSLGTQVVAIDQSPAMCLRTEWNGRVLGRAEALSVQCLDVTASDWTGKVVHADPDRRAQGDRPTKRLEQYRPDLAWMQTLTRIARGGAIKVGSASNFLQKFPGCEIELISLHGECREATVWFGDLRGDFSFRATTLPTGEALAAEPLSEFTNVTEAAGAYLFDPDPAIVRSGLLDVLAARHNMQRLDADEEYLTGDMLPATAFVTAFEVEAVLPNHPGQLKQHLRGQPSTHYEVKCRRIPVEAAKFARSLPTGDAPPRVILLARIAGRAAIVVARRIGPPQGVSNRNLKFEI